MCLLTYYLLAHQNYTQLLKLLNRTTDPELLCIKLVAQMRMHRADLAEATLRKLKQTDEDNCLTVLAQAWLTVYKCGMPSTIDELIS